MRAPCHVGVTLRCYAGCNEVHTTTGVTCDGSLGNQGTITGNPVESLCDTTPPVITPQVGGTLAQNGWYVSDVTVSWAVSDPESSIGSTTDCAATTISSDTGGTTLTCSATSAGGTGADAFNGGAGTDSATDFNAAQGDTQQNIP